MAPVDESTLLRDSGGADDAPEDVFTSFAMSESLDELRANWRSMLTIGLLNIATGILCLLFPIVATQTADLFLTMVIFVSGLFNVLVVCSPESSRSGYNRYTHYLFWTGLAQLIVAIFLFQNPLVTATILTYLVAGLFMVLGMFQIMASRNRTVSGRGLLAVSGSLGVLMSIIICVTMPTAKLYTIGVLMGCNLLNIGMARVLMACYGRSLADSPTLMSSQNWEYYLERDFV